MAVSISIDGVSRTAAVDAPTLSIRHQLGSRRVAKFNAFADSDSWRPDIGDRVLIQDTGGTYVFSGMVDQFDEVVLRPSAGGTRFRRTYAIECASDEAMCDRRLHADSYASQTLRAIVLDVVADSLSGETIDTTNVATGPTIELANFDYVPVSQVFNELQDLTGYAWWCKPAASPQLYFQQRGSQVAPYSIAANTTPTMHHIVVRRHRENYRNKQYLRAGVDLTAARTDSWKGDSATRTFVTAFPVGKVPTSVTVNAVAKTIGINQVDTGKDFYWNEGSNEIVQDSAGTLLTSTDTLAVTYQGQYPILVQSQLDAEISARMTAEGGSGLYESKEDDPTLNNQSAAIAKTNALLLRYGTIPVTIYAGTHTAGFDVGQLATVTLPDHDIAGSYLISELAITWRYKDNFTYDLVALSGDGVGGWINFFRALMETKDQFVIRNNEVVLLVRAVTDAVICAESAVAVSAAPETRVGFALVDASEVG